MTANGVSLVSARAALILVDRIVSCLRKEPSNYLASLPPSPNLSATMLSTISALRLAGISSDGLDQKCFEVAQKATDLAWVLTAYLEALRENNLVDYCDVLRTAAARLAADPSILSGVLVLVPEDLVFTAMERSLVESLPRDCRRDLVVDRTQVSPTQSDQPQTDAALLRWILSPGDAPVPVEDGTAEIFSAIGEANEIREVLRRTLYAGYGLDEVELLHTDTDIYMPLIFETFMRLEPDPQFDDVSLPVTFAEGIPTRYSRPGRALVAWMAWMRQDYPQATLVRMIQEGLLKIPESGSARLSFSVLAEALRDVRIGMGRDNYVSQLLEKIEEVQNGKVYGKSTSSKGSSNAPQQRHALGSDLKALKTVLHLVEKLLELSPVPETGDKEIMDAATRFLRRLPAAQMSWTTIPCRRFWRRYRRVLHGSDKSREPLALNVRQWLELLPDQVRVGGSGPRPGCLHVDHVRSGGHSSRKHTFIVGMDDSRFPGVGLNDPLLLDGERGKLSWRHPTHLTRT